MNHNILMEDNIKQPGPSQPDWAQKTIDLSDLGLFLLNENKEVTCWNQWMVKSSGIAAKEAIGKPLSVVFPHLSSVRFLNAIDDALTQGMPSVLSQKLNPHILPLYKVNQEKLAENLMSLMIMLKPINAEKTLCLIQVVDVSSSMARDKMLRFQASEAKKKEQHNRAILSSIADAVITTNATGHIDYMNSVAEEMTGWPIKRALNSLLEDVFSVVSQTNISSIKQCIAKENIPKTFGNHLVIQTKNGTPVAIEESLAAIVNDKNEITGVVLVFRDVSEARKLADKVNWQAEHDALTKLYNRNVFDQKLQNLIETTLAPNSHHALLYLDLDQFKIVNDTCGHVAGDELLKQVSQKLNSYIRNNDVLARLGGDEFGIQLENCPIDVALRIANSIRQAVKDILFPWGDKTFRIGISIGVVEITENCDSVEHLLSAADAACYAAKDAGRNQVHLYQAQSSEAAARHGEMQWFSRIQQAIENNKFCLYAQTIVPLKALDDTTHVEILLRMLDDNNQIIPPGSFIPAAERFGLMSTIDRWVVSNIFEMISRAIKNVIQSGYHFAINLSGQTLANAETLNFIIEQLEHYKIPTGVISFEITETAAISNLSAAKQFIKILKSKGCQFSLDDFGSGLSSFAYLKNLPVDFLKIDGEFVKDIVDNPIDLAMVQSINQIGHVMELKTIAEFVENDEILEKLQDVGVDYAQGYGICKPFLLSNIEKDLTPNKS